MSFQHSLLLLSEIKHPKRGAKNLINTFLISFCFSLNLTVVLVGFEVTYDF